MSDLDKATEEDVREIASNLAEDKVFIDEVKSRVAELFPDAAYNTENNPGVEMTPEQEGEMLEAAVDGLVEALEDYGDN